MCLRMKKVISLITAFSLFGCSFPIAATEAELKAQLNKNNTAIEAKEKEINQVENKKKGLLDEIEELDLEMKVMIQYEDKDGKEKTIYYKATK